jgi:hypothetical protein
MSFIDDIVSVGKSVTGFLSGNSLGSNLAKTAITTYALSKLYKSINKDNEKVKEVTRQQVDVNPDNSIPVVYGSAYLGGIITDAAMSSDKKTMYFCITLCEKTGNTQLGQGPASEFTFGDVYWNDQRLIFSSNGVDVVSVQDAENNICDKPDGKMKVYCYDGGSAFPVSLRDYPTTNLSDANDVFLDWTEDHAMTDLVFAIVELSYDSEYDYTSLGNFRFQITNSMSLSGDCLFDYMTNTRYGAGIPVGDIQL